jgi:hypothetical protein
MDIEKSIGTRDIGMDPRFVLHVVEGEADQQPGKIRTLRFDVGGGGQGWLNLEWAKDGQGVTTGLRAANIAHEHRKNGAFFLVEAYADDPNPLKREKGRALWEEWSARMENPNTKVGTAAFPDEWLPQKVLDLRKIKKADQVAWKAPPLNEGGSGKK